MFEKEAEEYAECMAKYYESAHGSVPSQFEKYLRKAVEYGYNKAKEDADKMKSRFLELCNLKDMRIEKLEKANEWHKIADGELPSEECGWVCNQHGIPCYYDWSTEQWLDCEGTQIRTTEWCNMPHKESE